MNSKETQRLCQEGARAHAGGGGMVFRGCRRDNGDHRHFKSNEKSRGSTFLFHRKSLTP